MSRPVVEPLQISIRFITGLKGFIDSSNCLKNVAWFFAP